MAVQYFIVWMDYNFFNSFSDDKYVYCFLAFTITKNASSSIFFHVSLFISLSTVNSYVHSIRYCLCRPWTTFLAGSILTCFSLHLLIFAKITGKKNSLIHSATEKYFLETYCVSRMCIRTWETWRAKSKMADPFRVELLVQMGRQTFSNHIGLSVNYHLLKCSKRETYNS